MDIRVITLRRTPERLALFLKDNAAIADITPFDAIDGASLDRGGLVEQGVMASSVQYSDGAVGCALSHRALWKTSIELQRPLTVVEDDAVLNHQFRERAAQVIATLADWDLIAWGWNFDSILHFELLPGISESVARFNQARLRDNIPRFISADIQPHAYRLNRAFGTIGYTVSPKGAERLAAKCFPIVPMVVDVPTVSRALPNTGIDVAMNSVYSHINAYVAIPPLVVTRNQRETSTVQSS